MGVITFFIFVPIAFFLFMVYLMREMFRINEIVGILKDIRDGVRGTSTIPGVPLEKIRNLNVDAIVNKYPTR